MKSLIERLAEGPIALLYAGGHDAKGAYNWVVYWVPMSVYPDDPERYREPAAEGKGFQTPEEAKKDYEQWREKEGWGPELRRVS